MKNTTFFLLTIVTLSVNLFACSAPHQPLKVHHAPGQPQKPNGCVMQAGQCKPANT